jgi:hypothetical protein
MRPELRVVGSEFRAQFAGEFREFAAQVRDKRVVIRHGAIIKFASR